MQELAAGYEDNETPEARLAHDADKIETLIQAIEYEALGADTRHGRETSLAALRTDAGASWPRRSVPRTRNGGCRSPLAITNSGPVAALARAAAKAEAQHPPFPL